MTQPAFERTGWSRFDIRKPAQENVESDLRVAGIPIETMDVSSLLTSFHAFRRLSEYDGEYRLYAGTLEQCLMEKALEHYISLILINPKPGMTGVDVGSCKSVLPILARRVYEVRYFEQDLAYPAGLNGDRIGSSADAIPLPDTSVDFMTLHCTFEHFENDADVGFIKECARLLKQGGMTVILPLYLNASHCNVTGETNADQLNLIGWDTNADHYCVVPEWHNRFGRHYSPHAFMQRVYKPAVACGLRLRLIKICKWDAVHLDLWLRWALVIER